MKKLFLSLMLICASAQAMTILPPATNVGSDIGRAFGEGFSEGYSRQLEYQRALQYQRALMELRREQIKWENENRQK